MSRKHILTILAMTSAAVLYADSDRIVSEISRFVYPANIPATPSAVKYMPDGGTYLAPGKDKTTIIRYDTRTGNEIETVFDCAKTRESSIERFEGFDISPDGSKLLVYTNSRPVYRRSFKAQYYVFDIKRNILKPLSKSGQFQQAPVFSPDNRMVAFVSDNNISLRKLDYDTEIAVTTDGKTGEIINGVPDWTYEEEFSTNCSMSWAPDSQTLCFLRYDESEVLDYSLPLYEGTCNPMEQYALYPGRITYKYPVTGNCNSTVNLISYDVPTRKIKQIDLPDSKIEYIPRIFYASPEQLLVATLNREQNRMEIYSTNPKSTISKSLLVEESKAWLAPETYENITLTDNSFIIFSNRSGYSHLYEYSLTGSMIRQLTSGDFDVTDCYGKDSSGAIYFRSTKSSPLNRVVSRTDIKGRTTDLTEEDKTATAIFTPGMKYMVTGISDAQTPPVYTLCTSSGKPVRIIEDNAAYKERYNGTSQKQFFTIDSDGISLNAYIILPENFDQSRKYPVIMDQYSGPGSQSVLNQWSMDWQYYAAKSGFIVVCVDGRGTGGRGREFEYTVYRNLGHYETIDQINAAVYIASLPYVDADRIGICGWSYGGYEALMAATAPDSPFSAVTAIAPVTDWRYYDTVYTERYMLTPQANESGYDESAPVNRVDGLKCPLLIMHGTLDDNVHPANTFEFVSRLQNEGKLCDMFIFPNKNHSIYGCNARAVVYGKMLDFFIKNL